MKRHLLLLSFLVLTLSAFAQNSNLVIFSDDGSKFYVVVNGLRVNDQALTNVRITDLNADYVKTRIVFEDETKPDIEKPGLMLTRGSEVTYQVKKNKKGETVCNFYSQVELAQAPVAPSSQRTIVYTQVPPNDGIVIRGNVGGTTTTTTTTTTGTTDVVGANVNVGGIGMNVTITDNMGGYTGTTSSTTTTTTSYSSGTTTNNNNTTYVNNDCLYGMSATDFSNAKNSISSASFDDTKANTFKQIVSGKCVTTAQVKEMLQLFSFEDNKLDMAKYAYGYVTDPSNYYQVNDIFSFSTNKDELSNYVMSNRR